MKKQTNEMDSVFIKRTKISEKFEVSYKDIVLEVVLDSEHMAVAPMNRQVGFIFSMPPTKENLKKWENVAKALIIATAFLDNKLGELKKSADSNIIMKGGEQKNDGRNKKTKTRRA